MKTFLKHTFGMLLLAVVALSGCMSGSSQAEEQFTQGKDYKLITPPIPTQVPAGSVEITELFWYGCPHCYSLEPTISKFLQQKPANVLFQRVPATLSPRWAFHAKLFYVGQMLDPNGTQNVHTKIFEALQTQRRRIENDDALIRFFSELGFAQDQIQRALKSMEMNAMLARATDIGNQSNADSVPVIIVNGKYLTSPSIAGSEERLLSVVNYLIKRESN